MRVQRSTITWARFASKGRRDLRCTVQNLRVGFYALAWRFEGSWAQNFSIVTRVIQHVARSKPKHRRERRIHKIVNSHCSSLASLWRSLLEPSFCKHFIILPTTLRQSHIAFTSLATMWRVPFHILRYHVYTAP